MKIQISKYQIFIKLKNYIIKINANNIYMMIYLIGILVGILNGLFASGAGQVLVFYLIFIKKMDTHLMRALSVSILSISSIFAIFGYSTMVNFDFIKVCILVVIAIVSGIIGSKVMKKIPSNILNLVSGLLISGLTLYKIFFGGN